MGLNFSRVAMLAGLLASWAFMADAATTNWQIDPRHSDAQFAITHLMIATVRGEFHGIKGTVTPIKTMLRSRTWMSPSMPPPLTLASRTATNISAALIFST